MKNATSDSRLHLPLPLMLLWQLHCQLAAPNGNFPTTKQAEMSRDQERKELLSFSHSHSLTLFLVAGEFVKYACSQI